MPISFYTFLKEKIETGAILFINKNILSAVPTKDDMITCSRIMESRFPSHNQTLLMKEHPFVKPDPRHNPASLHDSANGSWKCLITFQIGSSSFSPPSLSHSMISFSWNTVLLPRGKPRLFSRVALKSRFSELLALIAEWVSTL